MSDQERKKIAILSDSQWASMAAHWLRLTGLLSPSHSVPELVLVDTTSKNTHEQLRQQLASPRKPDQVIVEAQTSLDLEMILEIMSESPAFLTVLSSNKTLRTSVPDEAQFFEKYNGDISWLAFALNRNLFYPDFSGFKEKGLPKMLAKLLKSRKKAS